MITKRNGTQYFRDLVYTLCMLQKVRAQSYNVYATMTISHNVMTITQKDTLPFPTPYLPTIQEFPGLYRKIGCHPGIPEILYNSRIRTATGACHT